MLGRAATAKIQCHTDRIYRGSVNVVDNANLHIHFLILHPSRYVINLNYLDQFYTISSVD